MEFIIDDDLFGDIDTFIKVKYLAQDIVLVITTKNAIPNKKELIKEDNTSYLAKKPNKGGQPAKDKIKIEKAKLKNGFNLNNPDKFIIYFTDPFIIINI